VTALTSGATGVGRKAVRHAAAARVRRSPWARALPVVVATADLGAGLVAVAAAVRLRYPGQVPDLRVGDADRVGYAMVGAGVAVVWVGVLAVHGVYRSSQLGSGNGLQRVARSGLTLFGLLAAAHLLTGARTSGRLVVGVVVLAVLASILVHLVVDRVVREARLRGRWRQRAVLYGPAPRVQALADRLDHDPGLGVDVVATCRVTKGPHGGRRANGASNGNGAAAVVEGRHGEPAVIDLRDAESVRGLVVDAGADMVAVTAGAGAARVRSLAWAIEGTGAQLLVAPTVPGLDERPIAVEPVAGVPLLRLPPCRLTGARLAVKAAVDRAGAALLLLLLSPVLAATAVCVRLSGPGPVIFRQVRVGQHGRTFEFLKFRTMVDGADRLACDLADDNESDGLLFKLRCDPRVTRVGRWMRRLSLDELPQLWNVLRGDMSLVGPRPLPVSPESFRGDARRRLRVKPGITGLWQVSGRSELSWAETVRLDVRYVDRWSLGLDLLILLRTPAAVLRGQGAY
jgi:exopolysaccharide biosynthesis polyprenyl glycosylphosphotransferase